MGPLSFTNSVTAVASFGLNEARKQKLYRWILFVIVTFLSILVSLYKLCVELGYTYDMRVYLGKYSHSPTDDMIVAHAPVRHLTCRVEGLGHKVLMDNFISSPRILMTWTDIR